jgi:hypothetical protein
LKKIMNSEKSPSENQLPKGPVAGLVGIEVGVVSAVFNLELPGVEAPGGEDHAMTNVISADREDGTVSSFAG